MGLKIQRSITTRMRVITTLIAVFALVAQPIYGFVEGQVANAVMGGATRYVANSGSDDASNDCLTESDPCTVPHAIDKADAGDTILIDGVRYSGNIEIDKELHLVGKNGAKFNSGIALETIRLTTNASGTSIKGFTLENRSGKNILKLGGASASISGLDISDNIFVSTGATPSRHLIFAGNLIDSSITGNTFNIANGTKALNSEGVNSGLTVDDNTFIGSTNVAILTIFNASNSAFSNNNFTGAATSNDKIVELQGSGNVAVGNIYGNNMVTITKGDGTNFQGVYRTVSGALSKAQSGDKLTASAGTYEESLNITKAVSIEGAGQGQTIIKSPATNPNNYVVQILNVADSFPGNAVSSLTVDGNNAAVHGINVFGSSSQMTIWGTTVKNNGKSGLNVNNSWVQGVDLTTENNGWNGVNVDKGSAFFQDAGINHHSETLTHKSKPVPALYVDDTTVGTVNDTNGQYVSIDNYLQQGDRAYFLKANVPATPKDVTVTALPSSQPISDNGYTTTGKFQVTWSAGNATPVDHYKYMTWTNTSQGPHNVETNPYIDPSLKNPTRVAFTNAGEGAYYVRVAACDSVGNCSEFSPKFTVNYDISAPVITGFDFVDAVDGFNPSKVVAHATDAQSYVTSVSIDTYKKQTDGTWQYTYSPMVQGTPMGGERSFAEFTNANPRISADGTYKLVAWATDKVGNVSALTESSEFTVDNTPPVLVMDSVHGPVNGILHLSGTASDATSGLRYDSLKTDTQGRLRVSFWQLDNAGNVIGFTPTTMRTLFATVNLDGSWSLDVDTTDPWFVEDASYRIIARANDNVGTSFPLSNTSEAIDKVTVNNVAFVTPGGTLIDEVPSVDTAATASVSRSFARTFNTVGPATTLADPAVLGVQTAKDDSSVLGASKNVAALEPSASGWKIYGVAWYWWVLIVAAVATILWWIIAAARRRKQEA